MIDPQQVGCPVGFGEHVPPSRRRPCRMQEEDLEQRSRLPARNLDPPAARVGDVERAEDTELDGRAVHRPKPHGRRGQTPS